ncbi:MAG: ABC transporter ATP-binding protein [Caldilineaceae bacterium]
MSDIAIQVENLSKLYRIGLQEARPETLAGALTSWAKAPLQNFRNLRRLSNFSTNGHEPEDTIWALKDVSFEVKHGEVIGVIGRNGAGKSTLLKILSRITEPTSGRATINGRVASLLEVGTGFHLDLTGRENVYLNGTVLGMKKQEIDRKFEEIVDFSGVEKFIDTPVKRYSSGMKVRLAFAVAAHLDPEILLIDEVLAVGDSEFQKKSLGKMENVTKQGRTVLFVSHNMTMIQSLCHRTILLNNGCISAVGKTSTVVESYIDLATPTGIEEKVGEFVLTQRQNLYRPSELIARRVQLLDGKQNSRSTFLMGDAVNIVIDVHDMARYHGADIGVIFKTRDDQWITSINSGMTKAALPLVRAQCEQAILQVPKIPFTPGTYWIDISIAQKSLGRLDYIERAASFTVIDSDVYGTGAQVSNYYGFIYLDATWIFTNKIHNCE